jgi:hypothetical protein
MKNDDAISGELAEALSAVALWVNRVRFGAARSAGVKIPDFLRLEAACRGSRHTLDELVLLCGKTKGTCHRGKKAMVAKGLVDSPREKLDGKKRSRIYPTTEGKSWLQLLDEPLAMELQRVAAEAQPAEREKLRRSLGVLIQYASMSPDQSKQ